MTTTVKIFVAAITTMIAFNITTATAQDVAAKTGHVTLMKRCDASTQSSCDASVQAPACDVSSVCNADVHTDNIKPTGVDKKKDYVGHVTLMKRQVAPAPDGCGPTTPGNPTSSTC